MPGLEGQSRGAEGTERSELALYGPDELWHLGPSTDPERGHLPTRNGECGCAPTKRLRCMRRTVRVPTGGSLDTGDAGGTGTRDGRWRQQVATDFFVLPVEREPEADADADIPDDSAHLAPEDVVDEG